MPIGRRLDTNRPTVSRRIQVQYCVSYHGPSAQGDGPVALRDDQRKLKSGAFANGLLIVAVAKGGPAANAGLEALQEMPKQVLVGLAVAGSMVFPPAMILLPVFASLEIG